MPQHIFICASHISSTKQHAVELAMDKFIRAGFKCQYDETSESMVLLEEGNQKFKCRGYYLPKNIDTYGPQSDCIKRVSTFMETAIEFIKIPKKQYIFFLKSSQNPSINQVHKMYDCTVWEGHYDPCLVTQHYNWYEVQDVIKSLPPNHVAVTAEIHPDCIVKADIMQIKQIITVYADETKEVALPCLVVNS